MYGILICRVIRKNFQKIISPTVRLLRKVTPLSMILTLHHRYAAMNDIIIM